VIPLTDAAAGAVRIPPALLQGPTSPTLVEAITARNLGLRDGQVVQAMVQMRGDEMALLLRGRQIGIARVPGWEVGQRISFRTQTNPDGSVNLLPVNGRASAYSNPGLPELTAQSETAPAPKTNSALPVVAVQNAQAAEGTGLTWTGEYSTSGTFSRLGALMYRMPGMPDVRQILNQGGLDGLLAKVVKQPEVQGQLQNQLQAMRLSMERISPEAINAALRAALGSETSLLRLRNPLPNDLKPMLHQLLALMEDKTEDESAGVQQVKRALGDLDAAQLAAVQAQNQGELAMSVVIPFVDHAPVELNFERKRTDEDGQPKYTVNIHSNSRDYGQLWLQADLVGAEQVSLSMWALRPAVVDFAREGQATLRQTLGEAGLVLRSFKAHLGARPDPEPVILPQALPGEVVDLRV